jgi:hypothetical protein
MGVIASAPSLFLSLTPGDKTKGLSPVWEGMETPQSINPASACDLRGELGLTRTYTTLRRTLAGFSYTPFSYPDPLQSRVDASGWAQLGLYVLLGPDQGPEGAVPGEEGFLLAGAAPDDRGLTVAGGSEPLDDLAGGEVSNQREVVHSASWGTGVTCFLLLYHGLTPHIHGF